MQDCNTVCGAGAANRSVCYASLTSKPALRASGGKLRLRLPHQDEPPAIAWGGAEFMDKARGRLRGSALMELTLASISPHSLLS
jgi:hypothetical protein